MSRTPILDTFKVMHTFMPEEPEVERYICQNDKTIYINMEARKGAQITKLIK